MKKVDMEKTSLSQWNPDYSSNLDFFDSQNRRLVTIMSQIQSIYESGSGNFLPAIKQLIHFLTQKFHEENLAMMIAGYPDRSKHIEEHLAFVTKIDDFLMDFIISDPDLGHSLLTYLQQWVSEHIAIQDVQFGQYLNNRTDLKKRVLDLHQELNKPPLLYVVNA